MFLFVVVVFSIPFFFSIIIRGTTIITKCREKDERAGLWAMGPAETRTKLIDVAFRNVTSSSRRYKPP